MLVSAKSGIVVAACLVAGCAFKPQVTGMAVDYNKFVADATNQQTVINILRARDREPMHFTSFSKIAGTAIVDTKASFESSIGGKGTKETTAADGGVSNEITIGTGNYKPTVSVNIKTGTNFDIGINANEDFYRGILNPVSTSTLVHYMRQGWNKELLTNLFIRDIRYSTTITEKSTNRKIKIDLEPIKNSPDDKKNSIYFMEAVGCRTLDYELSSYPEKKLNIYHLSELSGITESMINRVDSTSAVIGAAYSVDLTRGKTYKIALSDAPKKNTCQRLRNTLHHRFAVKLKDIQDDINLDTDGDKKVDFNASISKCINKNMDNYKICDARRSILFGNSDMKSSCNNPTSEENKPGSPQNIEHTNTQQVGTYSPRSGKIAVSSGSYERSISGNFDEAQNSDAPSFSLDDRYFIDCLPDGYTGSDVVVEISIRSIESVMYYLGEYIRNDSSESYSVPSVTASDCSNPAHRCQDILVPILKVLEDTEDTSEDLFVKVKYKGVTYGVPSSGKWLNATAGRSSQVLSLIQQMLNLHRSAEDLPTTPSVRVLN